MILVAKKICKSFLYPQKIDLLKEINLNVDNGKSLAICGRSGEGKTTLLHILGTLEEPDSGTLEIAGERFHRGNASALRNRYLGFIFQSYNLLEDFSTLENVMMPARIAKLSLDRKKAMELLDRVGLSHRAHFPAKLLSGGEKQRVALARALFNDPALILADEPSGNLDHANAEQVGQLLFSLVREEKKSLILVTHDQKLAHLCDEKYLLSDGHLSLVE